MKRVTRGTSQLLVGRAAELERLRESVVVARASDRSVVLLSGEAGIGKSRLLAEWEALLRTDQPNGRDVLVLHGSCLEVGESLAYLPVLDLLEGLEGHAGADASDLRDAFGGTSNTHADPAPSASSAGRAARFQRLRDLLVHAATDRDVVAIIDDVHWADRSSLDVLTFLARRLGRSGVVLVLAYRSDELHRRHPLKPFLAEFERQSTLDHVRLNPLEPAEVADQIVGILGGNPDPATLRRVVELADGNPFHVEELLSLGGDGPLPPTLRDVLDARLDRLDEGSRRVLQDAAVIGRQLDVGLLEIVSDLGASQLANGLRRAVDARLLMVSDEDGRRIRFRHALIREAVYDDLLPVERIDAHRRVARALTSHPELGDPSPGVAAADLARHWQAARSDPEAFVALLAAARSAEAAAAWVEARVAYEEVLTMWDRIDDPVSAAASARSGILERAADMAWYAGDARRALAFNRQAQGEDDVRADPNRSGRLADREAWLLDELGDLDGAGLAAERAYRLIPDEPPSRERAQTVSTMGVQAQRQGRIREGVAFLERSLAIAATIGADGELVAALAHLAMGWADLGEESRALEAVERLDELLPRIPDQDAFYAVSTCVPWVWIGLGQYERAIEYSDRYLVDAQARGLEQGVGSWYLAPKALAQSWLGRWDEATVTLEREGDFAWGLDPAVYLRTVAAQIAAGRGDTARGRSLASEAVEMARSGYLEHALVARCAAAWVELLDGHPETAIDHVRSADPIATHEESHLLRSMLLWTGACAAADLAAQARSRDDGIGLARALETGADLAVAIDAIFDHPGRSLPAPIGARLLQDMALAEIARLNDRDDPATWAAIADRSEGLGDRPRATIARLHQAESILRDRGESGLAADALNVAIAHADAMGATVFRLRALDLARAARLKLLGADPTDGRTTSRPVDPWGLSEREREVLDLLVNGRTNRQIGAALFISDKTASVHVTHILVKLGVSSRTEAALLAVRAGMKSEPHDAAAS